MAPYNRTEYLEEMEKAKDAVAALTGIKKQFTDNGWSEPAAEQMVFGLVFHGGGGHQCEEE
jgi:hypothetical protein